MKMFLKSMVLICTASSVAANDTLFAAPGQGIVKFVGSDCPDTMVCVTAGYETEAGDTLNLMLPQWAKDPEFGVDVGTASKSGYLRGLSDGYIVDFCNVCQCCVISNEADNMEDFIPWNAAPERLISPVPNFERFQ